MQLHAQETNLKITYKGLNADGQQVFELVADTEVFNRSAEAIAQAERDGQDVHVFDTLIDGLDETLRMLEESAEEQGVEPDLAGASFELTL